MENSEEPEVKRTVIESSDAEGSLIEVQKPKVEGIGDKVLARARKGMEKMLRQDAVSAKWEEKVEYKIDDLRAYDKLTIEALSLNVRDKDSGKILSTLPQGQTVKMADGPAYTVKQQIFVPIDHDGKVCYVALGNGLAEKSEYAGVITEVKIRVGEVGEDGMPIHRLSSLLQKAIGREIEEYLGLDHKVTVAEIIALFNFPKQNVALSTDVKAVFNGATGRLELYAKAEGPSAKSGGKFLTTPAYVFGGHKGTKEQMLARLEKTNEKKEQIARL